MRAQTALLIVGLGFLSSSVAAAQAVVLAAGGSYVSRLDNDQIGEARGLGESADLALRLGRIAVGASAYRANLTPRSAGAVGYRITGGEATARLIFRPAVQLEGGYGRWWITPTFAAQDAGFFIARLRSEVQLSREAAIWGKAGYLVGSKFNGGGKASLALDVGLGFVLGSPKGHARIAGDFTLQRLNRSVNGLDLPIQNGVARLTAGLQF